VERLLEDRFHGRKLKPEEIGVITPYRKQVKFLLPAVSLMHSKTLNSFSPLSCRKIKSGTDTCLYGTFFFPLKYMLLTTEVHCL
jgi:hypothetical protein